MSDLTDKFTTLESQLTTQQTEIMNVLEAILVALGGPPPTGVVTLADTNLVLTSINDNLIGMRGENVDFYAALLDSVGQINTNTDTIINNNSLNAQRLISAIYATFCDCVTDAPLLAPPIDVTPTELVDEAKCRRIQFYLSVFGNWLNKIANYGASGAAITSGTLSTLLAIATADAGIIATGAEVGAAGGIPGIIVGAVVGLIAVVAYTLGGSILIDYANQFNDPTLRDNMVQAMYAATNADEGYTAFKSTLLAGMDTIPAEIMYTLWWSAWSNDVYSGSPEVDDSAFDGSICVPEEEDGCVDIDSISVVATDAAFPALTPRQMIYLPVVTGRTTAFLGTSFDQLFVASADLFGYSIELIAGSNARIVMNPESVVQVFLASGVPHVIDIHTTTLFFDDVTSGLGLSGSYTIRLCEPE